MLLSREGVGGRRKAREVNKWIAGHSPSGGLTSPAKQNLPIPLFSCSLIKIEPLSLVGARGIVAAGQKCLQKLEGLSWLL